MIHGNYWLGGSAGLGASLEILEKRTISCPSQESKYSSMAAQPVAVSLRWLGQKTAETPHTRIQNFFPLPNLTVIWQRGKHINNDNNINSLTPNNVHISHTTQLTSRRCILNIYSTNILTEYFIHAAHSPVFFFSVCHLFHNAIFFGSCNIHILYTVCAKILKKIPAPKG